MPCTNYTYKRSHKTRVDIQVDTSIRSLMTSLYKTSTYIQ